MQGQWTPGCRGRRSRFRPRQPLRWTRAWAVGGPAEDYPARQNHVHVRDRSPGYTPMHHGNWEGADSNGLKAVRCSIGRGRITPVCS